MQRAAGLHKKRIAEAMSSTSRFSSITASHSSFSNSTAGLRTARPALFTRMSKPSSSDGYENQSGTARATFHEASAFALHCSRAASHNGAYVASRAIIGKDSRRRREIASVAFPERLHPAATDRSGRPIRGEECDQSLGRFDLLRSGHDRRGEHLV